VKPAVTDSEEDADRVAVAVAHDRVRFAVGGDDSVRPLSRRKSKPGCERPVPEAASPCGARLRSLADVAELARFSDQSRFLRHFKRFVGVTPGQFRTPARIA
jgi:AraC-like DNA-binding protein